MKSDHVSATTALPTEIQMVLNRCYHALDDKKAEDIRILDVRGISTITDFLILATGTSQPHLRALRIEMDKVLSELDVALVGVDEHPESGWSVIDAFDLMVHLFTGETRQQYRLEQLWKDARELPTDSLSTGS